VTSREKKGDITFKKWVTSRKKILIITENIFEISTLNDQIESKNKYADDKCYVQYCVSISDKIHCIFQ